MTWCAPHRRSQTIAQDLFDRLDGAIFVAHNARFDYGFLRAEFDRAGLAFHAKTLCTVRLSRICTRTARRTRSTRSSSASISTASNAIARSAMRACCGGCCNVWCDTPSARRDRTRGARVLRRPALPPNLPPDAIDALPHAPGVYLFYGLNEHPIYIGKSVDLRARVAGHFNAEHRAARDLRLSQEIHRLEWEETAGEFGALLRESELVKTRLPAHNVRCAAQAEPGAC